MQNSQRSFLTKTEKHSVMWIKLSGQMEISVVRNKFSGNNSNSIIIDKQTEISKQMWETDLHCETL